jgi:hypothetical protein
MRAIQQISIQTQNSLLIKKFENGKNSFSYGCGSRNKTTEKEFLLN